MEIKAIMEAVAAISDSEDPMDEGSVPVAQQTDAKVNEKPTVPDDESDLTIPDDDSDPTVADDDICDCPECGNERLQKRLNRRITYADDKFTRYGNGCKGKLAVNRGEAEAGKQKLSTTKHR